MFNLVFGLPWAVVALRFILPLPWHWSAKIALAALLLVASQYHFFSRLSSGSVFSPEFPRPLIIAFNALFAAIIFLAVFQIALDIGLLVLAVFKGRIVDVPAALRYALGVVALLISAYGVSQAIRVPALKDLEFSIAGLPKEFDGYRLVQLTDLHISRLFPASWAREVVAKANALDADLIVVSGDFIDGSLEHRRVDVAPLASLRARDGVFAIPGNHEYFFSYDEWMRHLGSLGMEMLLNAHTVLARGESGLVLAGVTDLSAARYGLSAPDLATALAGAPVGAPVILLDHQPMRAMAASAAGVALQLSGHTHGGMVLGLDRMVARANNGFVSGHYQIGDMALYVNNGTGLWPGFAVRLGVPAELTRITLRRR